MVVEEGMPPADWIARWTSGPAALIGETPTPAEDSFAIIDLRANRQVDPASFRTRSRNQPFAGMRFAAWPVMTVYKGKVTHNELLDV
jgi:dihydroorotase